MDYKFKAGQRVATKNKVEGIIEKTEKTENGNSYFINFGEVISWVNESMLHETTGINEEYLTEEKAWKK